MPQALSYPGLDDRDALFLQRVHGLEILLHWGVVPALHESDPTGARRVRLRPPETVRGRSRTVRGAVGPDAGTLAGPRGPSGRPLEHGRH